MKPFETELIATALDISVEDTNQNLGKVVNYGLVPYR
jgi:hypothetical protein